MLKSLNLNKGWTLREIPDGMKRFVPGDLDFHEGWSCTMPEQVHSVLIRHGRIDDPLNTLDCSSMNWVSRKDWLYTCYFDVPEPKDGRYFLRFDGVDTVVDVFLNGEAIAFHKDMFLPLKTEVTGKLSTHNRLDLRFVSPWSYIEDYPMHTVWKGLVPLRQVIRKGPHDFCEFNGPKPYLTPMGIFADVALDHISIAEISDLQTDYALSEDFGSADLSLSLKWYGSLRGKALFRLLDMEGVTIAEASTEVFENDSAAAAGLGFEKPSLWFPRGFGEQPLYTLTAELRDESGVISRNEKIVAFRRMEINERFDLKINGLRVRMLGGNLTPLDNHSHVYDPERMDALLDLAEECHFNSLRTWGGGESYPEDFFRKADERGFLVWFDFFHRWDRYPDDEEMRELCRNEAEYYILSLRHHPCICLWCGGNESYLGREAEDDKAPFIGAEIFEEDYPKICSELDPGRLYIPNSPCWGEYSNDPRVGDTHGYTHIWFNRGADYPLFLSENCRVSIPNLRTMRRYFSTIEGDFWPEGFSSIRRRYDEIPIPPMWRKILGGDAVYERFAILENYYDADSPESLIYAFGAAHGQHLRDTVEAIRRGRPASDSEGSRRSNGHMVWKFNDSWPLIFSGIVDYYLDCYIPYYALKRAYEPFLVSFEKGDSIHLWLTNDGPVPITGSLRFVLFDTTLNVIREEHTYRNIRLEPDASKPVTDLDFLHPFRRSFLLYASFSDETGTTLGESYDFMATERRISFPDAKLTLGTEGDEILIETDKYAHSIELSGDGSKGTFGWKFSDNYFNLIPGQTKRIYVYGNHNEGEITAKPYYSPNKSRVTWKRT